jgi:hypothetical protein
MMKLFPYLSFSFPFLKSRKQSEQISHFNEEKFANFLLSISQLVIEKNELKSQIAGKFFTLNFLSAEMLEEGGIISSTARDCKSSKAK